MKTNNFDLPTISSVIGLSVDEIEQILNWSNRNQLFYLNLKIPYLPAKDKVFIMRGAYIIFSNSNFPTNLKAQAFFPAIERSIEVGWWRLSFLD
jgi:hypothetical protein